MNPYGPRPDHLNPEVSAPSAADHRVTSRGDWHGDNRGRLVIRFVVSVGIVLISLFGMVISDGGFQIALGALVILVAVTYALGRRQSAVGLLVLSGLTVALDLFESSWLAAAIWLLLLIGVWYARPTTD